MLKKLMAVLVLIGMGAAHAFSPQTGTWVVSSELDGRPGRGIALDVQNTTLVMQMYAYEQNGQPTFYLGVGQIGGGGVANVPLVRYSGGRYFGSGAQSGKEAGSPGSVSLRFTSGTTGFATFPGEPERAISRFNFGYPAAPASLRGLWNFTSIGSMGLYAEVRPLSVAGPATSSGNGLVATQDGLFACEHQVQGALAGSVLCIKISAGGQLERGYVFVYSVNDGEGRQLTSTGALTDQVVAVRRLTTPNGDGTGLVFKDEGAAAPNFDVLRQQISDLAGRVQAE